MSQRKIRQSSEEAMAAREAMENALPENVTPITLPDPEWDDAPAPEEPSPEVTDEDIENFMAEQGQAETEQGPDEEEPKLNGYQVECPCCGAIQFVETNDTLNEQGLQALAVKFCKCSGAKVLRQESEMNDEIDKAFGPESKDKYGIGHTPEELIILKLIGAYVAKRKIKSVTVKMNGGDNAIFLIKKDATIVRHTRTIKAEAEV